MEFRLPALNLKAKLMALMVVLLGLTLGAELLVSLNTENRIVAATQDNVKELASAIQISVQELTSVGSFDRDRLQNYVNSLHTNGLEVSIASPISAGFELLMIRSLVEAIETSSPLVCSELT